MQEFFHIFVINFFLFVTLLKSIGVPESSCIADDSREFGAFPRLFPDISVSRILEEDLRNRICNPSVSPSVLSMTAAFAPLFPLL